MPDSLHLSIPEPCHENWKKMTPNEQGRHCMACQKTVVDFSLMSDKEILDYISQANSNICGRFDQHQLDRGLRENKSRKRVSWIYVWNLLVMFFLFAGKTKAQGGVSVRKVPTEKSKPDKRLTVTSCPPKIMGETVVANNSDRIQGIVLDAETADLIPFATITIGNDSTGTMTDSSGYFEVNAEAVKKAGYIMVSAIGYGTKREEAPTNPAHDFYVINLNRKADELDEVVVVGYESTHCRMVAGGLTMVQVIPMQEKVTRQWEDWFPKTDVVVYPNPLPPGQSMQVALQFKETGPYRLEIIDGSGRVMWIQNVNVPAKKHTISLATQRQWPAGIYWLRLTGAHNRSLYNRKIVLR